MKQDENLCLRKRNLSTASEENADVAMLKESQTLERQKRTGLEQNGILNRNGLLVQSDVYFLSK